MKNRISSERADLFEPNIYITVLFDIIGDIIPEALIAAINRAFTSFEATMSSIELSPDGEACYKTESTTGCSAELTHMDLLSIIGENEKTPFSIQTGELMRVFVKPSENKTTVLMMAHHLVGDGKSIVYFIESVMNAYSGNATTFRPLHLLDENLFPNESLLPRSIHWWVDGYNRRWRKTGRTFNWDDHLKLQKKYWQGRESVILVNSFSPENLERIHTKAKEAGVSLNSYMITAFLKANKDLKSVGMAVDARMDGNRTMSNQASGITLDYSYNERLTFAENATKVHNKIYKKLSSPAHRYFILRFMPLITPSLLDSVLMHTYGLYENPVTKRLANKMGYTSVRNTSFGVTNLTRLDIPTEYAGCRIENLYFIPPVVSYSRQTIGISTTESGMTITCHCMSDQFDEKMKRVFNDTMGILLSE